MRSAPSGVRARGLSRHDALAGVTPANLDRDVLRPRRHQATDARGDKALDELEAAPHRFGVFMTAPTASRCACARLLGNHRAVRRRHPFTRDR
jgi:hypothetical protein